MSEARYVVVVTSGVQITEEVCVTRVKAARRLRSIRRGFQKEGYSTLVMEPRNWDEDPNIRSIRVFGPEHKVVATIAIA